MLMSGEDSAEDIDSYLFRPNAALMSIEMSMSDLDFSNTGYNVYRLICSDSIFFIERFSILEFISLLIGLISL